jgi:WD40 repeat protein/serine/threonine protein kinase
MDNQSGGNIKGYELRERIGAGGFGAVYRAYQSTVGREVAIKIILPGFANQPDFIRRFETEAQVIARLEHPHITPLYDYWRDPDGAYLAMRWLRGGSLRETLQNGPLDVRSTALFLEQISGALALAHRNHVIHRDLKPGNILLDEDGNVYLADFGIAKDLKLNGSSTQPDAIVGSLDYISPEQARSEPVTPRTDIYSLGVMLYEVLAGHHPFQNISSVERLYKHINDALPELTNLDGSVSDAVNHVIQKATAKNPDYRYPDALALAADFREAAGLNRTPTGQSMIELLTQREHEILRLIIEGLSNKEIAGRLTVTLGTVKWYVNQIYAKLHVRSRVQAIVRARELNLIGGSVNLPAESVSSLYNLPEPENPYKGLRAFQSADVQDFFGRDELSQKLVKRMGEDAHAVTASQNDKHESHYTRFLAVVGPSGSGKSSLVKAGLIPALWRGDLPGSERWFIVEMLPGAHPLDKLEVALMRVAAQQANALHEQLARNERGLLRASELILPDDDSQLVIVIDQFEEVFTLVEDEAARQHFLNLLCTAVKEPRSRVRVVITLRADFYDRPLNYPDFGELVRARMETVMPLSAKGLERAIAGPAERVGVKFEPGLVASMVAETNYQAGALPLLQYALTELFERREGRLLTHAAYQEIGGAVGALAKRAEELYADLSPEGQAVARQMFLRLVTLGEGVEDTRRRATRAELLAITVSSHEGAELGLRADSPRHEGEGTGVRADSDLMDEIIDTYADYRLLTLDNEPGTRAPTIELAHEAILREWERLRNWLNASRDEIRLQRQLAYAADEWHDAKQDTSFLLSGSRLETFEKWAASTGLALTPDERAYLTASLTKHKQDAAAETERQAREVRLERRSQTFLRGLVAVLLLATLGAFGLSGVAITNASAAQDARATSDANLQRSEGLRLVGNSTSLLPGNTVNAELASILAIRSLNIEYSAEAEAALTRASQLLYTTALYKSPAAKNRSFPVFFHDQLLVIIGQSDNAVYLHNIKTGQSSLLQPAGNVLISYLTFSPDGTAILAGFRDGSVRVWNTNTLADLFSITGKASRVEDSIEALAMSYDSSQIVAASFDHVVRLWNMSSSSPLWTTTLHGREGSSPHPPMNFSPDGRYLAVLDDNKVIILDAKSGALLHEMDIFFGQSAVFSSDNKLLMTSSNNGLVTLFDAQTGTEVRRIVTNGGLLSAYFSSDDKYIVAASADGTARMYDAATGQELRVFSGHFGKVGYAGFSPDGTHIITEGQDDNTWRVWDARLITGFNRLSGNYDGSLVFFTLDGKGFLVAPSERIESVLYDAVTLKPIRYFSDGDHYVTARALSPDGKYLFASIDTVNDLKHVKETLFEIQTGKQVQSYFGHTGALFDASFSPDSKLIVTGATDGTARIWDVATGKELHLLDHRLGTISAVSFRADGKTVFTGGFGDGIVREWDVETGALSRQFETTSEGVFAIVADTGRIYVAGSRDVSAWDIVTGQRVWKSPQDRLYAGVAVLSPDNRQLATGGTDGIIRFWDTDTGKEVRQISGLSGEVFWLDFSKDGSKLVSGTADNRILFWQTNARDLVRAVCPHLYRDMNDTERGLYLISDNQMTCPTFGAGLEATPTQ